MSSVAGRLKQVQDRILGACREAHRDPREVTLIAVSKTRSPAEIRALADLGLSHFGENYLQEALAKLDALADRDLTWHFIGPLQSNKTRDVAARFDWVHSVDREKLARRLNDHRPDDLPPLNVLLQVNIDREDTKRGAAPEDVAELARVVSELPRLRLRGLMAIPRAGGEDGNREAFHRLAMTLASLRLTIPGLDALSMGMSDDFPVAIAEGATHVRVGTALFGPRPQ